MSDTIYLVACAKRKGAAPAAARDLYASDWFRSARAYVEAERRRWFILSALHGLLPPEQRIEPYDVTLKGQSAQRRRQWSEEVASALRHREPALGKVLLLAGEAYAQFLVPKLLANGIVVERPMLGLRQGEQLRWLKAHA